MIIMDEPERPNGQVLLQQLHAGGATDGRVSHHREWVIARAPSGNVVQVLWLAAPAEYYVSRWLGRDAASESLGTFPERDAAVACALDA
jgi:hypothetical protein